MGYRFACQVVIFLLLLFLFKSESPHVRTKRADDETKSGDNLGSRRLNSGTVSPGKRPMPVDRTESKENVKRQLFGVEPFSPKPIEAETPKHQNAKNTHADQRSHLANPKTSRSHLSASAADNLKSNVKQGSEKNPYASEKTKFQQKHIYEGMGRASFTELTDKTTPLYGKEYIVKQNILIHQDTILPHYPHNPNNADEEKKLHIKAKAEDRVNTWFANIEKQVEGKGELTIIDTNFKNFDGLQFDNKKQSTTLSKYEGTFIKYFIEGDHVVLKAYPFSSTVQVKKTANDEMHFEKLTNKPDISKVKGVEIARFTKEELVENAIKTGKIWYKLTGSTSVKFKVFKGGEETVNNLVNKRLGSIKVIEPPTSVTTPSTSGYCRRGEKLRRRKRKAERCAFYINRDGTVEEISPREFVQVYKDASAEDRRTLVNDASKNLDKVADLSSPEDINNLKKLVNLKSHTESLNNMVMDGDGKYIKSMDYLELMQKQVLFEKTNTRIKLSPSLVANRIAGSSKTTRAAEGIVKVGTRVGLGLLTKSVIDAIINNDTTTLVVIGVRVGYDVVTSINFVKKIKIVGKYAGLVGAIGDIGLSTWGLVKSVLRLQSNNTSRIDRNDAVAATVGNSVDIAITVATVGISFAFPPAMLITTAVGIVASHMNSFAVSWFQGLNQIQGKHEKVNLLQREKRDLLYKHFFLGIDTKDYIDYLIESKESADLVVQDRLKFFRDNPHVLGMIFPSVTIGGLDGTCNWTKVTCTGIQYIDKCWSSEKIEVLQTGCSWNRICMSENEPGRACVTSGQWNALTKIEFRCSCEKFPDQRLYFREDSIVDFTVRTNIIWERDVPNDVPNGEFKCKSSAPTMNPKVAENKIREGYKCEDAVALLQPPENRRDGQIMIIKLEGGRDNVYLNKSDPTPNVFYMGSGGNKVYYGGGGENTFIFDGDCSKPLNGELHGSEENFDTIIISENCAKGKDVQIDFKKSIVTALNSTVEFSSIEIIQGRVENSETVVVSCKVRQVKLQGGTKILSDQVHIIAGNKSCPQNVTVLGESYTSIYSNAESGCVSVLMEDNWQSFIVETDIQPNSTLDFSVLFQSTPSRDILLSNNYSLTGKHSEMILTQDKNNNSAQFTLNWGKRTDSQSVKIYFNENPPGSDPSLMEIFKEHPPMVYHLLKEGDFTVTNWRFGARNIPNVFNVLKNAWNVVGGDENDEFLLNCNYVQLINGGGGEDTLKLGLNLKPTLHINLTSQEQFISVERVLGVAGRPATVTCGCDTTLISLEGGSAKQPDTIMVPESRRCSEGRLLIFAKGHSSVFVNGTLRDIFVVAGGGKDDAPLRFHFVSSGKRVLGLTLQLHLDHRNWRISETNYDSKEENLHLKLKGKTNEFMNFVWKKTIDIGHVTVSPIQIILGSDSSNMSSTHMVIDHVRNSPTMFHTLNGTLRSMKFAGFSDIQNVFRVQNGSWEIIGGNKIDSFILEDVSFPRSLNGGGGHNNVLIFEDGETNSPLEIDLSKGEFYLHSSTQKSRMTGVQHVVGRFSLPDTIRLGCETRSVDGRGGLSENAIDDIFIPERNCSDEIPALVEIKMGEYTKVENLALSGSFLYKISDPLSIELVFNSTSDNLHIVEYTFTPGRFILNLKFNVEENILKVLMANKTKTFRMVRSPKTGEFVNPIIRFHPPREGVTMHIDVTKEGDVMGTIVVKGSGQRSSSRQISGLPVEINKFLVNVTENNGTDGRIISGFSGSKENQFWILNLETPIDKLDGGICVDGEACKNYLQIEDSFRDGNPIEIDLNNGGLTSLGNNLISIVTNFHEVVGRNKAHSYDKVTVACNTLQVSNMEEVIIPSEDCSFNLVIAVGEETKVVFKDPQDTSEEFETEKEPTFFYKFSSLRSFNLDGSSKVMLQANHSFQLFFSLDEVEAIRFDVKTKQLFYSIRGTKYYHVLLEPEKYQKQFYQPTMITRDNFQILVSRSGSILLSSGELEPSLKPAPVETVQVNFVPAFEAIATQLGVSIMIQVKGHLLYLGHAYSNRDRNVLENSLSQVSHLHGGGAEDTIYEIHTLQKDVYIYPGFLPNDRNTTSEEIQQTLDLTDIIAPIRMKSGVKYIPKVVQEGKDLAIFLPGYEDQHPGKIYVVESATPNVTRKLQVLLDKAIMDFVAEPLSNDILDNNGDVQKWKIVPRPILIPDGFVYSISKGDLEDGHRIQVADSEASVLSDRNASIYQAFRKGSALLFSNVAAISKTEDDTNMTVPVLTTIIFTDFYQEEPIELVDNATSEEIPLITVTAPGLHVVLQVSEVMTSNQSEIVESSENVEKVSAPIFNWTREVEAIESAILEQMPDLPLSEEEDKLDDEEEQIDIFHIVFIMSGMLLLTVGIFIYIKIKGQTLMGFYDLHVTSGGQGHKQSSIETENSKIQFLKIASKNDE